MSNRKPLSKARVAIVHEWLVDYSGSERVVEQILNVFPDADLFAVVDFLPAELRGFIRHKPVSTTFVQRLPKARQKYRNYLPFMPLAVEQHDLSGYDLVLSSSHAVAKGVLTGPDQLHLSYVHSPIRYAWDLQHEYLREAGLNAGIKAWLARWILHRMRMWDLRTVPGVDRFVANSEFIRRRIRKTYGRDAEVIYPPVDVEAFSFVANKEDFYFTAARMVPYKRVDLIVESFARMPGRRLIVAGDGPELSKAKAKAGPNVEFVGYCGKPQLIDLMQRAKAFVFAAQEDFGITPVEAQACGTPVIAFGRGGATESIRGIDCAQPTGVFFEEQTVEAIASAIDTFESMQSRIKPAACRSNALRFSPARFQREYFAFVERAWADFQGTRRDLSFPASADEERVLEAA